MTYIVTAMLAIAAGINTWVFMSDHNALNLGCAVTLAIIALSPHR